MQDKVIVITGASGGIGLALAELVVARGARVVLAARRTEQLTALATRLGDRALAVPTDVTRRADNEALRDRAIAAFDQIDVWVANAGRGISRMPSELTDEDIDDMITVNLKSLLYAIQAVLPHFKERGRGQLVAVSSGLARFPFAPQRSAYSAAKAGMNLLMASLRGELRATHPEIHATTVMPGVVATPADARPRSEVLRRRGRCRDRKVVRRAATGPIVCAVGCIAIASTPAAAMLRAMPTKTRGYRARFEALVDALEAHPDVAVIWKWFGEPATPAAVRAAGTKLGWKMTDEDVAFYTAINGATVAWVSRRDLAFDPKVHKLRTSQPKATDHETLGAALGVLAFLPITEMARKPLDYKLLNSMDGPSRIAFELPGNYYTPALTFTSKGATVQVGDDHGAAWDGLTCSFIDYVETTLATWGSLGIRKTVFGSTKGKKQLGKPVPLASLLPAASTVDDKAVRALFKKANRTFGKDLSDAELVTMVQALPADDDKFQSLFSMRLSEAAQQRRAVIAAHTPALVGRMDPAKHDASLAHVIMQIGGAFSTAERIKLLALATDNTLRGRFAAEGGAAIVPELVALWSSTKDLSVKIAITHAAVHLGAIAKPLAKLFEPLLDREAADCPYTHPELHFTEDEELAYAAAVALVAVDPSRADKLMPQLRVALRSEMIRNAGRQLPLPKLSTKAQTKLADALAEIALAAYTSQDQLAVFFALGDIGVDRVLRVLETKTDDYEVKRRISSIRSDLAYSPVVEKLPAKLRKRFAV